MFNSAILSGATLEGAVLRGGGPEQRQPSWGVVHRSRHGLHQLRWCRPDGCPLHDKHRRRHVPGRHLPGWRIRRLKAPRDVHGFTWTGEPARNAVVRGNSVAGWISGAPICAARRARPRRHHRGARTGAAGAPLVVRGLVRALRGPGRWPAEVRRGTSADVASVLDLWQRSMPSEPIAPDDLEALFHGLHVHASTG